MKDWKISKKDAPGFLDSFCSYFTSKNISAIEKTVAVVAVLAYIISPVDLIPDIPVVGWIDDIGVGALFAAFCSWRVKRQMLKDEPEEERPAMKILTDEDVQVFDSSSDKGHSRIFESVDAGDSHENRN